MELPKGLIPMPSSRFIKVKCIDGGKGIIKAKIVEVFE